MNLETFAAQVLKTNIPKQPNPKAALSILPPQQKGRSYKDLVKTTIKFEPELIQYSIGEHQNEWVLKYTNQLRFGDDRNSYSKKQIKDFAINYLKMNSSAGDEKYVSIAKADINQIWFQFDIVKWFNDNFKNQNPKLKPPMTLEFRYRNDIPSIIFIRSILNELEDFIEKRFEEWMKPNTRKLHHRAFEFLRKITPKFFEYKINIQRQRIRAGLKYTVVIGALALYSAYRHDKEFSKKELSQIKSKVGRLGDVEKLDKYLKKL